MNSLEKGKKALLLVEAKKWLLSEKSKKTIYSSEIVKKICDIPYRRLSDWDRKDILPHQEREGVEGWRTFSFCDIFIIKIVSLLRNNGYSVGNIQNIYNWLSMHEKADSVVNNALHSNKNMYIATDMKTKHEVLTKNDFDKIPELCESSLFMFSLNSIFEELFKKMKIYY